MYYHYCTVTYETFVLVVFHVNLFFELLVFATVTALLFFCTCLCVSFIQTGQRNRSKLLADDDIPLTCIDAIYIGTCFTILYLSVTQHYIGIFPSKIIMQKYVQLPCASNIPSCFNTVVFCFMIRAVTFTEIL